MSEIADPNGQRERLLKKHREAQKEPTPFPLVSVCDVQEIYEQSYLVQDLIPTFDEGAAGYIFGPPKIRKSLLLCEIALAVPSGTKVMDRYEVRRPGASVGFFAEDPKSETSRRIHRLARGRGIDVPRELFLIDVPALAIDSLDHQRALLATLRGVADLSFVWLDPMVRLHSINDNRAEEIGPIHTFLRKLSRELPHATCAYAHHTNHAGGARGSTDYGAFGDFNLYLESGDELTTRVRKIENRGGPPGTPFSFRVEDLAGDVAPAMRLVPDDRDATAVAAEQSGTVAFAITSFKDGHPGMAGKEAMRRLRATGFKFGNDEFWDIWKGRDEDD